MTTEQNRNFSYSPLSPGCIRLLKLLPLGTNGELQLELVNDVSYATGEFEYTTLSYCWGDPDDTLAAHVDGKPFRLTRNLHEALVAIQKHHLSLASPYLWVDAICIDQENDEEKGRQVAQMWRVYQKARLVLAWLGAEDDTTDALFHALAEIRSHVNGAFEDRYYRSSTSLTDMSLLERIDTRCQDTVNELEADVGDAASPGWRVFQRPYFSRVWVITECVQAGRLVFACGKHECSFGELEWYFHCASQRRVRLLTTAVPLVARAYHRRRVTDHFLAEPREVVRMLDCLWDYSNAECADERDRVYAMLGHPFIRKMDPDGRLKVDYSLSNEELYVLTLVWIDAICADFLIDEGVVELYAPKYSFSLQSSLGLDDTWDLDSFLTDHPRWHWWPGAAQLVLPGGKRLDCSGPVMRHIINHS